MAYSSQVDTQIIRYNKQLLYDARWKKDSGKTACFAVRIANNSKKGNRGPPVSGIDTLMKVFAAHAGNHNNNFGGGNRPRAREAHKGETDGKQKSTAGNVCNANGGTRRRLWHSDSGDGYACKGELNGCIAGQLG